MIQTHEHLHGIVTDLPHLQTHFEKLVPESDRSRYQFQGLDFFKSDIPKTQLVMFGHILHDWPLETRKMLLQKTWDALDTNG